MTRMMIATLTLLFAASAQAACIYPKRPERIPDGRTATYDEMLAAQKAVQQFNEDINSFNACLDLEMAAYERSGQFDENRLAELRVMQAKKNNAAVDDVQSIADLFNEQLRIFKTRDKQD
jgi:hypothetical protein